MTNKNTSSRVFKNINEARYRNLAEKKCDCVIFTSHIPVIFIHNPKRINLRSITIASGSGIIFFRPEAESKARKISNIFSNFDYKYSGLLTSQLKEMEMQLYGLPVTGKPGRCICTEMILPDGIYPHEGIEYALMQKRLKHLALFEHLVPVEFITDPLGLDIRHLEMKQNRGRIYYMPGYAVSAHELRRELSRNTDPFDEDHVRRVGQLLGYQPTDIEQFLAFLSEKDDLHS